MKNGFTLIEVLIATILVGLAVAGLVGANISFTKANGMGVNLSTAEFLTDQIRELTALLPIVDPQTGTSTFGAEEASIADYDDLDDFDGATFNPPISSIRNSLSNLSSFSQQVTVTNADSSNLQQDTSDHGSDFYRVTVKIFYAGDEICSTSWIRARY